MRILLLLGISFALLPVAADAAAGGLTPAQLRELKSISFAVVPDRPPSGFHAVQVHVDKARRSYWILYSNGRGASIRLAGAPNAPGNAPAQAATSKPHGLFSRIGGLFQRLHKPAPQASQTTNVNDGKAGEEEEEMTAVSADSPVLGPVSFAQDHNCLNGAPDPQKGIAAARFSVDGCNMSAPDALIRFYRSLVRVGR